MSKRNILIPMIGIAIFFFQVLPVFAQTPHIVSTSPTQNQLNVPVNTSISVTFDIDMDQTSFNDSTLVVNASLTGLHRGTITYNSQTKTASLDPLHNFDVGEVVTAVLTKGIQSSQGFPLDSSFAWSFTTIVTDGGGAFVPDSTYPVGNHPYDAAAADLDGDGDIDLAIVNNGSSNVSVLLNNGHGTFAPDSTYSVGSFPRAIAAADFDRDGDIDLAVVNNGSVNAISVLLNNGDGTFAPQQTYYVCPGYARYSICAVDLNLDGYPDLVVTSGNSVYILFNNRDGTFTVDRGYEIFGWIPYSLTAADLDGDGHPDIATVYPGSGEPSLKIMFNNGDGTFGPWSSYTAGTPQGVSAADLNGDGNLDLVTASTSGYLSVFLNNGDGTFSPRSVYPTDTSPYRVYTSDLDGDGDLDLLTLNGSITVLLNNGDGTFGPYSSFYFGFLTGPWFCVGDFDGDGDLDVATVNYSTNNTSIILNFHRGNVNGDGVVDIGDVVFLVNYLFKSGPAPHPLVAGDCNCDGLVDVGDIVHLINYLFKSGLPPSC